MTILHDMVIEITPPEGCFGTQTQKIHCFSFIGTRLVSSLEETRLVQAIQQ